MEGGVNAPSFPSDDYINIVSVNDQQSTAEGSAVKDSEHTVHSDADSDACQYCSQFHKTKMAVRGV